MKLKVSQLVFAGLLIWLGPESARGQQKQPVSSLQEDCGVTFAFTAASSGAQAAGTFTAGSTGTTSIIDNRSAGCLDWLVTYSTTTTVTVISLAFQTATDVAGTPTTWSNYPGTLSSGINPNTVVTLGGAVTEATGPKYPFLRMNLTVKTGAGTVQGKLYGWKRRPTYVTVTSGGGCPGTVGTRCVVVGPTASGAAATTSPVLIAGWNGSLVEIPVICDLNAFVNLSASGNTQIVALSGTKVTRVCKVLFSTTSAEDVKLVYGTGANCVTGPTDFSPLFKTVQSGVFPPTGSDFLAPTVPSGKAVCFNQSAAQANGVWVFYAQY